MNVRNARGAFIQGLLVGPVLALVVGIGVAVSNEDASAADGLLIFVLVSLFGAPFLGASSGSGTSSSVA